MCIRDRSVSADFVLTGPGGASGSSTLTIPREVSDRVGELPEVDDVLTMEKAPIFVNQVPMSDSFGTPGSPVASRAPAEFTDLPLVDGTLSLDNGVLLAETMAERFGAGVGSEVQLASLDGHTTTAPVVGTYGQAVGIGRAIIAEPLAARIVSDNDIKTDMVYVRLADGVTLEDGRAAIEAAVSYTHLTLPTICSV